MTQIEVIKELENYVNEHLEFAISLKDRDEKTVLKKPSENSWNALECLEHLNRYGDFYLTEISRKVKSSSKNYQNKKFRSNWFEKYSYNSMIPKEKLNKMKTFASKDPSKDRLNLQVIETFIKQQENWLELLNQAKQSNLNKNKCKTTLPLIRFNLGSTLKFVIYHNQRHIIQANRALNS